jgi:hypothetical protein
MRAIQLGIAIAFLVGALIFVLSRGGEGGILGQLTLKEADVEEMNTTMDKIIEEQKEDLSRRVRPLRENEPEAER